MKLYKVAQAAESTGLSQATWRSMDLDGKGIGGAAWEVRQDTRGGNLASCARRNGPGERAEKRGMTTMPIASHIRTPSHR
jgi:hypothetical protein